jgi:hypothetical protein
VAEAHLNWDFRVGDVVKQNGDILLVVSAEGHRARLLLLSTATGIDTIVEEQVEEWDGHKEKEWDRVVLSTTLVHRRGST